MLAYLLIIVQRYSACKVSRIVVYFQVSRVPLSVFVEPSSELLEEDDLNRRRRLVVM